MPGRLDAIDKEILKELQTTAASPTWSGAPGRHFRAAMPAARARAEEAGFIKGYRALLDEKLLGYEVTVFAMVHLTSQAETTSRHSRTSFARKPLVRECWMLSGEIDFILKCVAPDFKTPGLRRRADGRAACAQRQDLADAAQFQGRRHGADGSGQVLQFQELRSLWHHSGARRRPGACTPPMMTIPLDVNGFMESIVLVGERWHDLPREQLDRVQSTSFRVMSPNANHGTK